MAGALARVNFFPKHQIGKFLKVKFVFLPIHFKIGFIQNLRFKFNLIVNYVRLSCRIILMVLTFTVESTVSI